MDKMIELYKHEAERQVAMLRQQVAAIEQEAANKKNSELAQLASAQLAAQQELSNDYQSCIEQTHAALSDAHQVRHTKLIEASSWLIWGRAIITAEHTAQMTVDGPCIVDTSPNPLKSTAA